MKCWISRDNLPLAVGLVVLTVCGVGMTFVHGWNDDDGILKWNPTWFSNFKYSTPIGIRNRGYLFKRLAQEKPYGYRWNPNFFYSPYYLKRTEPIVSDMNVITLPLNRDRVLGWYNGPGSSYQLAGGKSDQSEEENDDSEFEEDKYEKK